MTDDEAMAAVLEHMNAGHTLSSGWGTGKWECSCGESIHAER